MGNKGTTTVRSVIDIGTNSVKLLVADVSADHVQPLFETSDQTRLGRGFYETHELQGAAIEQTAITVAEFAFRAKQYSDLPPRVIATSAVRDAKNASTLISEVAKRSSLDVEVISGEEEAELVFRGVAGDPNLASKRLLIVDVGGGSTEMVVGEAGHHTFQQSFDMGSVRLMEKLKPGDPPSITDVARCREWLKKFFKSEVTPSIESFLGTKEGQGTILVGTGGTSTLLARMEGRMNLFQRDLIEGRRLKRAQVLDWMVHLWSLALEDRRKIVGLPSKRADIILMGVAIYEAVMQHFDLEELYVSTRGLRFGAVMA